MATSTEIGIAVKATTISPFGVGLAPGARGKPDRAFCARSWPATVGESLPVPAPGIARRCTIAGFVTQGVRVRLGLRAHLLNLL